MCADFVKEKRNNNDALAHFIQLESIAMWRCALSLLFEGYFENSHRPLLQNF